jgi:C-terminal peptidase prc
MPRLGGARALRRVYQALADGTIKLDLFVGQRDRLLRSRELPRSEAGAFARSLLQAVRLVQDKYVEEADRGDLIRGAVQGLYRSLDEPPPGAIPDALARAGALEEKDLAAALADFRERLGRREDLDNHKDVDLALQRMLGRLGPYASYIDPDSAAYWFQSRFVSIGVRLAWDETRDMPRVVTPVKGGPAHKAGIQAGDLITAITLETDQEGKRLDRPDITATEGAPRNEVQKKLFGNPGTSVVLTVERAGEDRPRQFTVVRALVEGETVLGSKRQPNADWDYYLDPKEKIAYVRLSAIRRNTPRELRQVVEALVRDGLNGLVLDLRFNRQDHTLDSAVGVAKVFISNGLIATVRSRGGQEVSHSVGDEGSRLDFPMACLVNGGSAGNSEVVAACLQDRRRALIVGEGTEGRGVVEGVFAFEGGKLLLPVATVLRPSGTPLNRGVRPDPGYLVELSARKRADLSRYLSEAEVIRPPGNAAGERADFRDVQLDKALEYLRGQVRTRQGRGK